MNGLTHASFFSGVGGTDLGLERAGFRTVSFSEIDPYACAVLSERWPGVPNVGNVVTLAEGARGRSDAGTDARASAESEGWRRWVESGADGASLWSGGFPCQDLSVAGKRAGFAGERSSLAFAFLALVERHRPPAILLENVPGLLSSNRGADMARLLGEMVELGYGVAYRILDAQHFGVPQRRRRVFILGLRSGPDDVDGRVAAERAAAVLSVGTRCDRHPATGRKAGQGVAERPAIGLDIAGGLTRRYGKGVNTTADDGGIVVGPPPDPNGVREADGLAGRSHDRQDMERPWVTSGPEMIDASGYHRERIATDVTPTLNGYSTPMLGGIAPTLRVGPAKIADGGPGDTVPVIAQTLLAPGSEGGRRDKIRTVTQSLPTQRVGTDDNDAQGGYMVVGERAEMGLTIGGPVEDDPLLPLGLDSHRYRCCGNGVVAPVAEWLGKQLLAYLESRAA